MKKIILGAFIFASAMLFNNNAIYAQSFEQGDINVGGGIGVGTTFAGGLPIAIHAEYGISDVISVGGYAAFTSFDSASYDWNYTIFGARGAYHFGELLSLPDEFDLYGGVGIFTYSITVKNNNGDRFTGGIDDGIHFGLHAGARYYFTDNIAAFAELSHEISYLQLGVSIKL